MNLHQTISSPIRHLFPWAQALCAGVMFSLSEVALSANGPSCNSEMKPDSTHAQLIDDLIAITQSPGFSNLSGSNLPALAAAMNNHDSIRCQCNLAGYLIATNPNDPTVKHFCNAPIIKSMCVAVVVGDATLPATIVTGKQIGRAHV